MSHSDPLVLAYGSSGYVRQSPSASIKSVLDGSSRNAMVSLVSYLKHMDDLEVIPQPNIAFSGQTLSTLLISSSGTHLKNEMEIAVSADTKTTLMYMELVLKRMKVDYRLKYSESIEAEELLQEAGYALVIGDEALRVFNSTRKICLDIGYEFNRLYHMEPVYAVSVRLTGADDPDTSWCDKAVGFKSRCSLDLSSRIGIPQLIAERYYNSVYYSNSPAVRNTVSFAASAVK